jgi:hypothetical protein
MKAILLFGFKIGQELVDEFFTGPIAEEAKKRGTLMAAIFNSKLEFLNKTVCNTFAKNPDKNHIFFEYIFFVN